MKNYNLKQLTKITYDFVKNLELAGLPVHDVNNSNIDFFVLHNGLSQPIAYGAFEVYRNYALLRSCVIPFAECGNGYGSELIRKLITWARGRDIKNIFLLTESEVNFFKKCDFYVIDRNNVPKEIASTAQFVRICPDEATAMRYDIILIFWKY